MPTLQITSVFTGQTWDGEVQTTDLDEIFRLFNRVDTPDAERLAKLGFNQPSMSSGDLLVLDNENYVVASRGFGHLTDSQAAAYRFQIERAGRSDVHSPAFPKMEGDALRFLGNDGHVEIAPDGMTAMPS